MSDQRVIYETAVLIEAAGFKRPMPQFGQIWFDNVGRTVVIAGVGPDDEIDYVIKGCIDVDAKGAIPGNCIFAPTATDILKELHGYSIHYHEKSNKWMVLADLPFDQDTFMDANPAEAAAMAWLAINEKK